MYAGWTNFILLGLSMWEVLRRHLAGAEKRKFTDRGGFFCDLRERAVGGQRENCLRNRGPCKKIIKGKGERINRTVGFSEIAFSSIHPKEDRLKNIYKSNRECIL